MIDLIIRALPWAVPVAAVLAPIGLLAWEIHRAPLVDSYGNEVDPDFDTDVDQIIAAVADREDRLYLQTGHRDHELPGGVL